MWFSEINSRFLELCVSTLADKVCGVDQNRRIAQGAEQDYVRNFLIAHHNTDRVRITFHFLHARRQVGPAQIQVKAALGWIPFYEVGGPLLQSCRVYF